MSTADTLILEGFALVPGESTDVILDVVITGKSARQGKKSRDHLEGLIEGKEILLSTSRDKREKYGRYLAEIWLLSDGVYTNINDLLVADGHAEYKTY